MSFRSDPSFSNIFTANLMKLGIEIEMDAFEIAERCDISLKKARKVAKALSLRTGRKDERAAKMRLKLCRNLHLSVAELLVLLNEAALFRKLGKYEDRARAQTFALGNVRAGLASSNVKEHIEGAAAGVPENVEVMMRWLKSDLPPWPVRYHWIAVRLLFDKWPDIQSRDTWRIDQALKNVRAHPGFEGWSGKRPVGPHNVMFYHRPKLIFDL